MRQAAGWLDRDPADDRLAARDAAEHAAVPVGFGADAAVVFANKDVVVLAAARRRNTEPGSIFESAAYSTVIVGLRTSASRKPPA